VSTPEEVARILLRWATRESVVGSENRDCIKPAGGMGASALEDSVGAIAEV
jgi:hypothetical protein